MVQPLAEMHVVPSSAVLVVVVALLLRGTEAQGFPLPPDHPYALCPLFAAQAGTASATTERSATPGHCPSVKGLRKWKGNKFGVFMHWGVFSQKVPFDGQYPGASWKLDYFEAPSFWKNATGGPIACEGAPKVNHPWYNVSCPSKASMNAFRDSYWGLSKTFNPQQFDADKMMAWAKRVGFKYAVSGT